METYREQLKNITFTQYLIDFKEVKIIGDHAYEWGDYHHKYFTKDNPGQELEQKGKVDEDIAASARWPMESGPGHLDRVKRFFNQIISDKKP